MLRSTEILISLATEAVWWQQPPGTLSLVGSLLVTACVLSMAAHDKIIALVEQATDRIRCGRKPKEEPTNIRTIL